MTNPPQTCNPFIGADALSASSLQFLQQMQAVGLQQQLFQGKLYFQDVPILSPSENDWLLHLFRSSLWTAKLQFQIIV